MILVTIFTTSYVRETRRPCLRLVGWRQKLNWATHLTHCPSGPFGRQLTGAPDSPKVGIPARPGALGPAESEVGTAVAAESESVEGKDWKIGNADR